MHFAIIACDSGVADDTDNGGAPVTGISKTRTKIARSHTRLDFDYVSGVTLRLSSSYHHCRLTIVIALLFINAFCFKCHDAATHLFVSLL